MQQIKITPILKKILGYIAIQLITLWNIFILLSLVEKSTKMDLMGLLILTSLFLFYAYKTIQVLQQMNYQEGRSSQESVELCES